MAKIDLRYSAADIAARVDALAVEIAAKLPPDVLVVAVLKGSFVFTADLIRALSRHGVEPRIEMRPPHISRSSPTMR